MSAEALPTPLVRLNAVQPVLGFAAVPAGGLLGLEFQPVTVEVASRRGPALFQLVGLAETAVREARVRIGSALSHLGIALEEYALTVNLAPANVRKNGSGLDLAIAVAIIGATGALSAEQTQQGIFFAEVALDGSLRPVPGVLPLLEGARAQGFRRAFVAKDNAQEAAQFSDLEVFAASSLSDVVEHLRGVKPLSQVAKAEPDNTLRRHALDLSDVRGQSVAKRALLVAAAGQHHLLLVGPPGAGKSLLARRLPPLLPALSQEEALSTTAVHSVAGLLPPGKGIVSDPPFRSPHHTVSEVGLVGGGSSPSPGEISLAHNGVLFLDELPEFRRGALEALRQPLEDHQVHLVRARFRTSFPAHPLVVAAMNPCPCGNWGNPRAACRCSPQQRLRYLGRISGPLLDRIDLHVLVPPADLSGWTHGRRKSGPSTSDYRKSVLHARKLQIQRFRLGEVSAPQNSLLSLKELERVAEPTKQGKALLDAAVAKEQLSARGYVRVLRVARTLADLDDTKQPDAPHLGEALRYRLSDLANM